MMPLIDPVPTSDLDAEISRHAPLGTFRGLEIHSLHGDDCPATLREIGRLRERAFREAGAGRNVDCDLDELDFGPSAYRQLVAWDPGRREVVAVYRYQRGWLARTHGDGVLRTHTLFRYSDSFNRDVKPAGIELGRSVVNRDARRRTLGLFALWTGLYVLLEEHPELNYFFGNVSLYASMPEEARDLLIAFLEHHYRPPEPALVAREALRHRPATAASDRIPGAVAEEPAGRIRALRDLLEPHGATIPPIVQSYMSLNHEIWFGQTARDADFGDALEIGLVVPIDAVRRSRDLSRFAPTR